MEENEFPCIGCLFISICSEVCNRAKLFDLSINRINKIGRCVYCGSRFFLTKLEIYCTVCTFSISRKYLGVTL